MVAEYVFIIPTFKRGYMLGFTNSVANVSYSDSTRLGASVRCVAR